MGIVTAEGEEGERIDDVESDLVRRAGAGDAEAFGELVTRHRTSALRVSTVVLGTSEGADDAVQEATLRAWRAVGTVDPERGFRSWYLRAVANTARNERRSRARRAILAVRASGERPPLSMTPDDAMVSDMERRCVVNAVNRLDTDDRLVIALRHFEQLSETEMAEILECRRGTVKSRLSRAMGRLRVQLARQWPTPDGAEVEEHG